MGAKEVYVIVESHGSSIDPSVEVFADLKAANERFRHCIDERLALGYEVSSEHDYTEDYRVYDLTFPDGKGDGVRMTLKRVEVKEVAE